MTTQKNEIIIISTFISGEFQEKIVNNCIDSLLPLGIDILLVAHSTIPDYILKKVRYFIYDSDNEFYDYHDRAIEWVLVGGRKYYKHIGDHTLPLLKNMRNAFKFVDALGYDFFYYIEGDSLYNEQSRRHLLDFGESVKMSQYKIGFLKKADDCPHNEYVDPFVFCSYVKHFLKKFPFPQNKEEYSEFRKWNNYGPFFENNLWYIFNDNAYYYKLTPDKFFIGNENYNLSAANIFAGVFYDTLNPDVPVLFLYNFNIESAIKKDIRYVIYMNGELYDDVTLKFQNFYIKQIENCEIKIKILIGDNEVKTITKIVNNEEIEKLKDFYFIE